MKQKSISCFTALLMGLTLVPASGYFTDISVVKAADQQKTGNVDGYDYELWNQNGAGSVDMQLGSNGAFSCSWSGIQNCLFRTGKKLGSTKKYQDYGGISINYDVDYQPMGNSYMCVYGWTEDPTVEYYIVEAWGDWRPPGQASSMGTVSSDGKQYDIYKSTRYNQPSIHGTETFDQYWSVQKTNPAQVNAMKNLKGSITVSNHFQQWEKAGLQMGKMYEVALNIEGYQSSGKADVKKNELKMGTPTVTDSNNTGSTTTKNNSSTTPVSKDSLKDAFSNCFKIGTSVSAHELNTASDFIKKHFNSITPENELKPESIINQSACQQYGNNVNTQVSFGSGAQQIMKFCSDNGIPMRGHTFVWYSQTPDWFFRENFNSNGAYVSATIMDQRLESFIKNTFDAIAKQYPKLEVYAYDVCNELFLNDGGGLRPANNSNWVRVYGDDSFVEKAFTYARKYAPSGCKLYLNDYNEYIKAKTDDIYNMAMKLKAKGVIDGIGMQSHLDVSYPSASVYETAMNKFISTGLDVQVTELDITTTSESTQASLYKDIFSLCVKNAAHIPAVTVWGTSDGISWRSSQNPLLFNKNYQPKEAYNAIIGLGADAPVKEPSTTTPSTPPTSTIMYGDLNGDKSVDLQDLIVLSQYLLKDISLTSEQMLAADVQYDNEVAINDLSRLKQYIMKDDVLLGKVDSDPGTTDPDTTVTGQTPSGSGSGVSDDFEGKGTDWTGRGDVTIKLASSFVHGGKQSLYVTDRTQSWNGFTASTSELKAGGSYSLDLYVGYQNSTYSSSDFTFGVQYDSAGTTQYENIADATVSSGKWTLLSGDFTLPSDAENISLYVQTAYTETAEAKDLIDFFIDDVKLTTTSAPTDNTGNNNPSTPSSGKITATVSGGVWSSTADVSWIDKSKPMVAFSFDDGPVGTASNATSMRIQNALVKNGCHATFFYWGNKINSSNSGEILSAYNNGFEVANHTWTHPYLTNLGASGIQSEINQTKDALNKIIGTTSEYLIRPPYLAVNQTVSSSAGVPLITCGIDTQDWNNASKDQIVGTLKSAMQNGSLKNKVILMHETYESTAGAVEEILPYLKQQGWQVVSVSEMFKANNKTMTAGTTYTGC